MWASSARSSATTHLSTKRVISMASPLTKASWPIIHCSLHAARRIFKMLPARILKAAICALHLTIRVADPRGSSSSHLRKRLTNMRVNLRNRTRAKSPMISTSTLHINSMCSKSNPRSPSSSTVEATMTNNHVIDQAH